MLFIYIIISIIDLRSDSVQLVDINNMEKINDYNIKFVIFINVKYRYAYVKTYLIEKCVIKCF